MTSLFGSFSSSRSFAHTIAQSAMLPLVIQRLVPLSTKPPSTRLARVIMPPGLEPKSGSVSPKQPIASPRAMRGSQCRFCASDPKVRIGYMTSDDCTLANERRPESPRSSSWQIRPLATGDNPAHP